MTWRWQITLPGRGASRSCKFWAVSWEDGPTQRLITDPRHPYTQALLSAVPQADPELAHHKRRSSCATPKFPSLLTAEIHLRRCPYFGGGAVRWRPPPLEALPKRCPVRMGEGVSSLLV